MSDEYFMEFNQNIALSPLNFVIKYKKFKNNQYFKIICCFLYIQKSLNSSKMGKIWTFDIVFVLKMCVLKCSNLGNYS